MSVNLDDYRDMIQQAAPEMKDTLDSSFHDAARVMSPAALRLYLDGARGLAELGRGKEPVIAFIEDMPQVVRECGEDVLGDCLNAAMKLSSMTSGEVITLMIQSLPTAARRLGDPDMLRSYLTLIHQLSARAARGLRPMLSNSDELLSKLTLSGLKRWASFGAEAYSKDLNNLVKYFALETADSRKMLQKQRRGTLFIDTQRKLNFYLRALWGRDFFLRPTAADYEGFRPYIEGQVMHLPDALDDWNGISGLLLYRAQVAHMAAHICYSREALSAGAITPAQQFFIGLVEDARVEYCACLELPGLKGLWQKLLPLPGKEPVDPVVTRLELWTGMLADRKVVSRDKALNQLAAAFHKQIGDRKMDPALSWELGMDCFRLFAEENRLPSLRVLESVRLPHRDDNRFIWSAEEFEWAALGMECLPTSQRQLRKHVSVVEMANEVDCELAGDDAQEIWICDSEFMPYEDAGEATVSFNQMWGKQPISEPFHYHEWDYQVQLHRPDWTTVYEHRPEKGDPDEIKLILDQYKPVAHRIRQIIDLLSPQGVQRVRNLEDGDDIDINAAVDAMVAMRIGQQPNPRISMRNLIQNRDLAVTILLDLSESTNDQVNGSDKTVLALTREAATLVATAISGIGDPFAIHGFASDGRHDVQYFRFKDFRQPFDDEAKARLAGMKGGLSTRMGAAIRHAGDLLLKQAQRRKLLLMVTDGEPSDIDERDPQHLRHDTKKAVEELFSKGVMTYCLTLDPAADDYVKRIFGINHYTIVDHMNRLPEKLPTLFASLTS